MTDKQLAQVVGGKCICKTIIVLLGSSVLMVWAMRASFHIINTLVEAYAASKRLDAEEKKYFDEQERKKRNFNIEIIRSVGYYGVLPKGTIPILLPSTEEEYVTFRESN
jgi:hypothetical protein